MQAAVGDFVTTGDHVIAVFGDGSVPAKTSRQLQGMVALGIERTFEQDPAFAIRIMADIAVKALSAAINDPTTAVQALDHLGSVLRLLGSTPLHGPLTFRDQEGTRRFDRLAGQVTMRYGLGLGASRSAPGDATAGRWTG